MKNLFLLALASLSLTFFSSCSRDSQDVVSSTREIVVRGEWVVDYYYNTADRTALFNSTTFTFRSNGTFILTDNGMQQTGSWQMLTGVDRKEILQMEFDGAAAHVQGLNADWKVAEKDPSHLSMTGSEGSTLRLRRQ